MKAAEDGGFAVYAVAECLWEYARSTYSQEEEV